MKILRNAILAVLLGLCTTSQVRPQAKPEPVVEYVLGSCGGRSFTVQHAVIVDGKLTFDYFLTDPKTAKKDDAPLTFAYKAQPVDKDGTVQFSATVKYEGSDLELRGFIHGDRMVALLLVDGELGRIYYGVPGKVDDMVKGVEDKIQFCTDLHAVNTDAIPGMIVDWVLGKERANPAQ